MLNPLKNLKQRSEQFDGKGPESEYIQSQYQRALFLLLLALFVFVSLIMSMCIGAIDIPFLDTTKIVLNKLFFNIFGEPSEEYYTNVILVLRMPRTILCILTGASLGMAGCIMQGLLRNPLVSPFTLGVSTAAAFGAATAIVFGSSILGAEYYAAINVADMSFSLDTVLKTVFAFIFGLMSIGIVMYLTKNTMVSRSTIILSGVIISYIFQAGLMFTKYISDDTQLRDITMWMMGGFSGTTWGTILIVLPVVLVCGILLEKYTVDINMLSSGDDVASNLGVDVVKLRNHGLIISTLTTTVCIAFTGTIGFIGLMAPHMCRKMIGNDARFLLPASALLGAAILTLSDLFARVVVRPSELPVGIIMYIIGGAFFIWLVFGKKTEDSA